MISYWTIRERLLRVPGVANVAIWGERLQMMQVQVEPEKLQANGVPLEPVMETTADALDAGLLQYSDGSVDRYRWRHRDAQPTSDRPARPARSSTPDDLGDVSLGNLGPRRGLDPR